MRIQGVKKHIREMLMPMLDKPMTPERAAGARRAIERNDHYSEIERNRRERKEQAKKANAAAAR